MRKLLALLALLPVVVFGQSAQVNLSQLSHALQSGGIVPVSKGGTGLSTAPTNGYVLIGNGTIYALGQLDLTLGVKNVLPVANGGTGTATPGLVAGTNITITGTWPNQTINSTASGSGTVTSFAFTNGAGFTGTVTSATTTPTLSLVWAPTGDCSVSAGAITCLKTNGTAFSSLATLTPGTGVATWLGTPSLANLNTALGVTLPSTGTSNTTGDLVKVTTGGSNPVFGDSGVAVSSIPLLSVANSFSATNTFAGIIDSALTAGTSPVCPNGTGGALTTVGCTSGAGTVTDGSGTTTANQFLLSTTTAHTYAVSTAAQAQAALVGANAKTYTPTLASGATNDWDPTAGSIATLGFANTTPNAAGSTVNGILAGSDQQEFRLCNSAALGSGNSWILLENQSSSDTTAANRLQGAGNVVLGPQQCMDLLYSTSVSRWLMGAVANAGTGAMYSWATATSITPDCSFWVNKITASATGTFTLNAPTDCTPQPEQKMLLEVVSPSGATITYSWNASYIASATAALPTTSNAASKEDDFILYWSASKSAWKVEAFNQGF